MTARLTTVVRLSLRERLRVLLTGRAEVYVLGMVRVRRDASGHLLVPPVMASWRRAFAEWREQRRAA